MANVFYCNCKKCVYNDGALCNSSFICVEENGVCGEYTKFVLGKTDEEIEKIKREELMKRVLSNVNSSSLSQKDKDYIADMFNKECENE